MRREVRFYQTTDGHCPVQVFIDGLSGKAAKKVTWVLSLLEELEAVPAIYFKKLVNADEIWEVRVSVASDTFRIFCFFEGRDIVVLTHGLVKKTRKTPAGDIKRAESYRREYFTRRKRHE